MYTEYSLDLIYFSLNILYIQGEYAWRYTPVYRGAFNYFKGYLNNQVD